jgi:TPR repeat protein
MVESTLPDPEDLVQVADYNRRCAEKGSVEGMIAWAQANEIGNGIPVNLPVAVVWYERAIAAGNARAMYLYGLMLEEGRGVNTNRSEALRLIRAAADLGDLDAQLKTGQMLERLPGSTGPPSDSARYYQMAYEQGNPEAAFRLAKLLLGSRVPSKVLKIPELTKFAADHGIEPAQLIYAEILETGKFGTEIDFAAAAKYYEMAAEQQSIAGTHAFAMKLEEGKGVPQDIPRALSLYKRLIVNDFPPSLGRYGWLLVSGADGHEDVDSGKEFLTMAASKGDANSHFCLGRMAEQGIGEPKKKKNLKAAFAFYRRAADMGHSAAMMKCAEFLMDGIGCSKDHGAAVTLYQKLADQHRNPEAMFRLGNLMIAGKGVKKNPVRGVQMIELAAAAGHTEAIAIVGEQGRLTRRARRAPSQSPHASFQVGRMWIGTRKRILSEFGVF